MDDLKLDINGLKKSYNKIQEALEELKDIQDFKDEQYDKLYYIAEEINDLKIKKELELERMYE